MPPGLRSGQWRTLIGLQNRSDLNGRDARLVEYVRSVDRWVVKPLGTTEVIRVRPQNLGTAVPEERPAKRSRTAPAAAPAAAAPAAAAAAPAGEDEEGEEEEEEEELEEGAELDDLQAASDIDTASGEEIEEEEEEEEEEELEPHSNDEDDVVSRELLLPRRSAAQRLGLDFRSNDQLILRAVEPGTPADVAGARKCVGWVMTHVGSAPVTTLEEAAPLCTEKNVVVRFTRGEERKIIKSLGTSKFLEFRIPQGAPLNPFAPIKFERTVGGGMYYTVHGKRRPHIEQIRYSIFGQYFVHELHFMPLDTRMWLPHGGILKSLATLKAIANVCGVAHNIPDSLVTYELEEAGFMAEAAAHGGPDSDGDDGDEEQQPRRGSKRKREAMAAETETTGKKERLGRRCSRGKPRRPKTQTPTRRASASPAKRKGK